MRASVLRPVSSFLAFSFYLPWPFQPDCKCFLLPAIPHSWTDFYLMGVQIAGDPAPTAPDMRV